MTSTTPSVVLQNGHIGSVQDISVQPFVTGLIPVVGDRSVSPLMERLERLRREAALKQPGVTPTDAELLLGAGKSEPTRTTQNQSSVASGRNSTAERGDVSLAEIRRSQVVSPSKPGDEVKQLIDSARLAEVSGRMGAARIRYQRAASKASGDLKRQLLAKLKSLQGK